MPVKILIVDDDLQSLKLIGLMLQRRGYTIVAARGGTQTLEKAESDAPDLVILDVMMPDVDGAFTLDKRAIESTPKLPVSALLPPVPDLASQAAEASNLIIQLQPGSLIADQFRTLAQRLTT
jgi:CheY-like chemotaxis protein